MLFLVKTIELDEALRKDRKILSEYEKCVGTQRLINQRGE